MDEQTSTIRDLLGDAPDEARRNGWLERERGSAAAENTTERDMTMDEYDRANDAATDDTTSQNAGDGTASGMSRTDPDEESLSTADLASAAGSATAERSTARDQAETPDRASWESAGTAERRESDRAAGGATDGSSRWQSQQAQAEQAQARQPAQPVADPAAGQPQSGSRDGGAPLFPNAEAEKFRNRWLDLQAGFVDEPRAAVKNADGLVAEVIQRLAQSFADERSGLERQWDSGEEVSTEDLRVALRRYRSFFDRLLSV